MQKAQKIYILAGGATKTRSEAEHEWEQYFAWRTGAHPRSREEAGWQRRTRRALQGSAMQRRCNLEARPGAAPKGLDPSQGRRSRG